MKRFYRHFQNKIININIVTEHLANIYILNDVIIIIVTKSLENFAIKK
jgi:hypothetical protein